MTSRYSKVESLKIDYLCLKIKEIRYLEYELKRIDEEIEKVNTNMIRIQSVYFSPQPKGKNIGDEFEMKLHRLIFTKDILEDSKSKIDAELKKCYYILNFLTPACKDIAVDLYINKKKSSALSMKYNISNPYQKIYDELRYFRIDRFLTNFS